MWVTVRYRLYDSQGVALEEGERELTYLQGGFGSVFPKIEEALVGQETGYATSVYLQPEDGFGDYDADRVNLAARADFPAELEVGMTFEGVPGDPESDDGIYTVTDFNEEAVVLDGNHPLAGMALRFDLRVTEVRVATEEEVEQERLAAEEDEDEAEPEAADFPREKPRLH
jgi:FKBP-type peptidyl-prolyl cis-trans isomerase SlyD